MRAIFNFLPDCRAVFGDTDFARRTLDERDLATVREPRIEKFACWMLRESAMRRDIPATHRIKQ
jgi:hypothetical protein